MIREQLILLVVFVFISIINGHPSNSYYLIDIDNNNNLSSNESYCSNIIINDQVYRIPKECQHHLVCDPYYCDDKSFRCIKIRETLCCLHKYFQSNCQENNSNRIKDLFRSVYFQMSIQHGYCEINLERIEKIDQAYCIANVDDTTTTTTMAISTTIRPSLKYFHRRPPTPRPNRFRHRLATRQNYSSLANLDYLRRVTIIEENLSSKSSKMFLDYSILIFLFLLILN